MKRLVLAIALLACEEADVVPEPVAPQEEGEALGVPPEMIPRARREARGLSRMSDRLREEALARHRAVPLAYADLRRDPDSHAGEEASFEGQLALVGPAGENLWIVALKTRRDGARWLDPLYVLSVVDPGEQGRIVRVDGWVVGARRIGRHTLPLVLAYSVSE